MKSPCSGGISVSEKALVSMLGGDKFSNSGYVSQSEVEISDIKSDVESLMDAGKDANTAFSIVSSTLGISKSSLKRKLAPKDVYPAAYDEAFPTGRTRKYLESNMGKWEVLSLDPSKSRVCLKIGPSGVRLSVDVGFYRSSTSRT